MPNLNKVQLMGNITRDPEVRYTPKGTAVTDISLAINRNFSGDDGERREETTFVEITFWGRQAEIIGEWMKKGRPIYVEGRLQLDSWEDKTSGQQRSRLKVIGEKFEFLGGRDDTGGSSSGGSSRSSNPAPQSSNQRDDYPPERREEEAPREQYSAPQQQSGGQSQRPPAEEDDDIPF
ncbi:MAG TPA: single-stranded DNA-binding protein [Verrucomicrobiales bacterium]|jgi:single-strand DNA-binding protein|nr:single-stranded DNA-binding protein [Verrucomicrobiales bacterium]